MTAADVSVIIASLVKAGPYILIAVGILAGLAIIVQLASFFADLRVIVRHYADKIRRAEKYEIEELRHELFITKRTLEEAEFRTAISKGD